MFSIVRYLLIAGFIVGASSLFAAGADTNTSAPAKSQSIRFTFTDAEGQSFQILPRSNGLNYPDFKDKAVFAMFFIHTGTPCRNELQLLSKLKPKLPDLEVVAFELKGLKPDQLKAFQEELKLQGIHLVDTAQAMPFARFIAQAAGWQGSVPLIIFTDKKGAVVHMQLGAMSAQQIEDIYRKNVN